MSKADRYGPLPDAGDSERSPREIVSEAMLLCWRAHLRAKGDEKKIEGNEHDAALAWFLTPDMLPNIWGKHKALVSVPPHVAEQMFGRDGTPKPVEEQMARVFFRVSRMMKYLETFDVPDERMSAAFELGRSIGFMESDALWAVGQKGRKGTGNQQKLFRELAAAEKEFRTKNSREKNFTASELLKIRSGFPFKTKAGLRTLMNRYRKSITNPEAYG